MVDFAEGARAARDYARKARDPELEVAIRDIILAQGMTTAERAKRVISYVRIWDDTSEGL
jgi:hypothetical protein